MHVLYGVSEKLMVKEDPRQYSFNLQPTSNVTIDQVI